ncbi:MAG: hypothetical protein BRC34_06445 [Cyanobacteria bacterium QH_1_48_107]|nr:MAG: hypothetical protein BRC34_06445 [Cyanobacteria bacterium QH_1_48_107]PSO91840.1 MAG: hypothetical protein BRC48_15330 [Cyanobacteria bacterium QS_9_48_30]
MQASNRNLFRLKNNMIISYKNKLIFIHCRKVAGSAITAYLNQFIGPDDIQVGVWEDTILNDGSYNKRFYKDIFTSPRSLTNLTKHLLLGRTINPKRLNTIHKQKYKSQTEIQASFWSRSSTSNCIPSCRI